MVLVTRAPCPDAAHLPLTSLHRHKTRCAGNPCSRLQTRRPELLLPPVPTLLRQRLIHRRTCSRQPSCRRRRPASRSASQDRCEVKRECVRGASKKSCGIRDVQLPLLSLTLTGTTPANN